MSRKVTPPDRRLVKQPNPRPQKCTVCGERGHNARKHKTENGSK